MNKIKKLRKYIIENNCNAYLVPKNNEYFEEYSEKRDRLRFVTNFSGSAGLAIILLKKNYLFVDSRYILQAKKEASKNFIIYEISKINPFFFLNNIQEKISIGYDPKLFTSDFINKFNNKNIFLVPISKNLIDLISNKKEKKNKSNYYLLENKYHGSDFKEKIKTVIQFLKENNIKLQIITSTENICWLLNIRGNESKYSPLIHGKLIIHNKGAILFFLNLKKINSSIKNSFKNKIKFLNENLFINYIEKIENSKILIDKKTCSLYIEKKLRIKNQILRIQDPIYYLKSIKNNTEINNLKIAHLLDGIAFTKFIIWLKTRNKNKITEIIAQNKLETFKKFSKEYLGPSFPTISAYKENSAIVHYRATKNNNKFLFKNNIYLIDSGSQYFYGTTDVTRTIAIGKISNFQKKIYTLVLKSHLTVLNYNLQKNTSGDIIDLAARKILNKYGYNYSHGTGHGVGFFLNVHEGTHALSPNNKVKITPGMVISNEPGFYKKNNFGVRIENLIFCKKINKIRSKFENLTMIPYDLDCIDKKLLNKNEINLINDYHQEIYFLIKSFLTKKEKYFFKKNLIKSN